MKSPKPPDPYQTAAAQQGAEVGAAGASAIMNNPNTITPYGSQTYNIAGWEKVPGADGKMISVPRYTQTQTLSPDQMKLMGLNTQMQWNMGQAGVQQSAKLKDYLGKSIDTSKWSPWTQGPKAPAGQWQTKFADVGGPQRSIANQNVRQDQGPTDRAAIEKAMMANYTQDTAGQNAAQDAQMAARGLAPGSAQYGSMDQTRQQARGRAVNEAYLASGNEARQAQNAYNQAAAQRFSQGAQMGQFANQAQQQAYGQAMQRAGFTNEALTGLFNMQGTAADRANAMRGMQAQEAFGLRNQPINEITALLSGSQVNVPQFSPYQGQGITAPNLAGMIGQQWQQQSQQANAFNSGLFGLGSAALGGFMGM